MGANALWASWEKPNLRRNDLTDLSSEAKFALIEDKVKAALEVTLYVSPT